MEGILTIRCRLALFQEHLLPGCRVQAFLGDYNPTLITEIALLKNVLKHRLMLANDPTKSIAFVQYDCRKGSSAYASSSHGNYLAACKAASAVINPLPAASAPQLMVVGLPVKGSITLRLPAGMGIAAASNAASACAAVREDFCCNSNATIPATWGLDADVPDTKK
jgi:hypothetical protein